MGFFSNLFQRTSEQTPERILKYPEGKRFYSDFHSIRRDLIDDDALKVVSRLQQFNFKAYLVGGSVRDLLLGQRPKDYDVVTNAKPNEIRKIFANSRIIGKRFRIVHIVFRGSKIIEVSTARSLPSSRNDAKNHDELYLKKDNEYGSFKEDAARRDFTINSLFFEPRNETIVDYTGGFDDLKEGVVRIIGETDISLPEDPVRMLRAIKYSSLLNLKINPKLQKGIKKHRDLIIKASPARLHEEYNKIFRTGKSAVVFEAMYTSGLMQSLFPSVYDELHEQSKADSFSESLIGRRLAIGDKMIQEHEDINTNVYYALLIADILLPHVQANSSQKMPQLQKTLTRILNPIEKEMALTRKESERLLQMFAAQPVFEEEVSERKGWVREFKKKNFFPEAFIFYKILARARHDDEAIQKALFWEIGLRKKIPNPIYKFNPHPINKNNQKSRDDNRPNQSNKGPRNQKGNNRSSGRGRKNSRNNNPKNADSQKGNRNNNRNKKPAASKQNSGQK